MNKILKRGQYDPRSDKPFKLSRSKIEAFIDCPRCFYLDRRLAIKRPPGFPFTLNSAVDALLKKEFDIHRAKNKAHPLMKAYKIDAIPFAHTDLDKWRANFTGVQYLHEPTNFLIFGAVDDIWLNKKGELIVVDYKATSTNKEITLDEEYRQSYKRQMEIYQWLLRRNGFKVNNTGYFVYCNGRKDKKAFDGKLEFNIDVLPYKGNDKWVEDAIIRAHKCLRSKIIPKASQDCEYCQYIAKAQKVK
jgi:RecB family exonuclease